MPPDAWRPSSPSSVASHQFNNYGSDNPIGPMGGTVTSAVDNGAFRPQMFPGNGQTAVSTSSHMGINLLQGHHLGAQQIPPLQKPTGPPHNFPVQLQNQQGQHSLGPGSFGQNVASMQLPGQLPVSQPLTQQNASAGALQAPSAVQSNPMQPVPGQQQLPSNVTPQMIQQPIQQMPSQAPQLLLQQQAALQSSYQSSQQAIFQLQQQLQLIHQQHQQQHQQQPNLNQQPHTQVSKQQGQPNQSTTPGAPAAMMPTNINAIPQQVNSPAVSFTCNWTEHTSPEGFKYYYNSITRESKWEKPEEYVLYEQQQQQQQKLILLQQHQQKLVAQQLQSPPQAQTIQSMQSIQQHPQSHQGHNQMQMKQQELNYNQLQATGSIDPNRIPQGIQATQERSWKS
jgi:hypothetical protein